jgi:hypothetical protein
MISTAEFRIICCAYVNPAGPAAAPGIAGAGSVIPSLTARAAACLGRTAATTFLECSITAAAPAAAATGNNNTGGPDRDGGDGDEKWQERDGEKRQRQRRQREVREVLEAREDWEAREAERCGGAALVWRAGDRAEECVMCVHNGKGCLAGWLSGSRLPLPLSAGCLPVGFPLAPEYKKGAHLLAPRDRHLRRPTKETLSTRPE